MSLKIPGVRRVEAVQQRIKQLADEKVREKCGVIKHEDLKLEAAKQLGMLEDYLEIKDYLDKQKDMANKALLHFGMRINISTSHIYDPHPFIMKYDELLKEAREEEYVIRDYFKQKERDLWLCTTMEEVKAILTDCENY